jgi:hypothetical protein
MNRIERFFYNRLRRSPGLKSAIRNAYQAVFDLVPAQSAESLYRMRVRESFFFGFHDHTPFSPDNSKLLANRFTIPLRMPEPDDRLEIGYFDGQDHTEYHALASTAAWTWHMGCKSQWQGPNERIVFNDYDRGRYIARIIEIDGPYETCIPSAIGSVSPDGRFAVGYSFNRVEKLMPGYGYQFDTDEGSVNHPHPSDSGVYVIELDSGVKRPLLSIDDLAHLEPSQEMKGAKHFVTHTVFGPDSRRFIFLHRWVKNDVRKRWSRLVCCDINGTTPIIFPSDGFVSHIGWRSENQVIAYCRIPNFDDQYVLFNASVPSEYEIIGYGSFACDGHPSFDRTGRWMVTDTYPDRRRRQRVILYDTAKQIRYDIARVRMPPHFQSPSVFRHWSCDLHPRWDRSGRVICFDSAHRGERSLCTLYLDGDLIEGVIKSIL